MRQASVFIAALFCLALAAQQSASADETRVNAKDAANDKSSEWKEGSVWEGFGKARHLDGSVFTEAFLITVTKRDGKSFECRSGEDDKNYWKFDGEVDAGGNINMTITKVVSDNHEWLKKGNGKNLVGVKVSGTLDGKSLTLKAVQPDPDHPKTASTIRTWKLKLKGDE